MTRMTVREVLSADGTTLVYRAFGPTAAQPLVLLHGWAQSSKCWGDGVLDALAQSFRVIAVDLRGHGYSGVPESGYDDSKAWAADVDAVFVAEGVSERNPAVLLGWSYGGLVICDYLATHGSGAVSAVILVGAVTSLGGGEKGGRVGAAVARTIAFGSTMAGAATASANHRWNCSTQVLARLDSVRTASEVRSW